jgi:hypothetical protein
MYKYFLIIVLFCNSKVKAQELFVVTEPASNMPAKSIGVRVANFFMKENLTQTTSYHLMPELMVAPSKNIMLHIAAVASNRKGGMNAEGYSLYGKYRLYSKDDVHKHFRVALFGRYSNNNSTIHMHEISLPMHNSGYEYGTVATKLLHKTAISSSVSLARAISTTKVNYPYKDFRNVVNYSFSLGQLVLPKTYTSYKQTNWNTMLEFIGQQNIGNKQGYLDVIPSIQAIIHSVARIDVGYRKQLTGNIHRSSTQGFIIKLEYLFFNALK